MKRIRFPIMPMWGEKGFIFTAQYTRKIIEDRNQVFTAVKMGRECAICSQDINPGDQCMGQVGGQRFHAWCFMEETTEVEWASE